MSATAHGADIEAVLHQLGRAHAELDADAIADCYAPDAVIYDLAPPLGRRGINRDDVAAWLAGWEGPIQIDWRDIDLTVEGNLAFVSALNRMRGRQGGEDRDMWYRTTLCLRKTDGRWRIVCDHASVPFYMDGSNRTAVDLTPEGWQEAPNPNAQPRAKAEIHDLIENWARSVRNLDIEGVVSGHADDMLMFDVPPPAQIRGIDGYRQSWTPFFDWLKTGATFEIARLDVTAGEDVAYATALLRCGLTEELATNPEPRLRLTVGLRREAGRWVIAHEHHSFPLNL